MTDDQFLLASAYVDDELDARDAARAESDPVVMAEVSRLRELAASIRDVPPVTSASRSKAVMAALDAWTPTIAAPPTPSTSPAPSAPPPPPASPPASGTALPPPTPLSSAPSQRSRTSRSSSSWLLGAAAVLVLAFGAFVVTRGGDSTDSAIDASVANAPRESSESGGSADSMSAAAGSDIEFDSVEPVTPESAGDAKLVDDLPAPSGLPTTTIRVSTDGPPVVITPMDTLQFTDSDLQIMVDQFTEPGSSGNRGPITYQCEPDIPDTATLVGHTRAVNDDIDRPTVELLIFVDDVDYYAYAVDSETCLVVRALAQ